MPPRKKRKRTNTSKEPPTSTTPATPPPILINDVKVFIFFDLRDNKKNIDKVHTGFRVHYRFVLNMKCCDGCNYINAQSTSLQLSEKEGDGEHNNEYAIKMKEQSLEALACHVNSNEGCLLDYNSMLGVLPQSDTFWRFMWGYAQNEMPNKLLETKKKSDESRHGHETRLNKLIEKDWEVGTAIEMKQVRHYVRAQVFDMLVLQSGKQIYCMLDMLPYMIGKVKRASNDVGFDFDEYSLVSPKKYKRHQLFEGMLSRAKECIRLMSC
jgi:hypothetical protein